MKVLTNQNSNASIGKYKLITLHENEFSSENQKFGSRILKNERLSCENLWKHNGRRYERALSSFNQPQTASMIHFKWNYVYWSTVRTWPKTVHNSDNIVYVGLNSLKTIETGLLRDHCLTNDEPLWFLVGLNTIDVLH